MAEPVPTRDWTVDAVDRLDAVVDAVREKSTVPLTKVARAVVFGLVAVVFALLALVLFVIGLLRLHVYLPLNEEGRKIYATYIVLGAIFVLVGMFLWRLASPRTKE
jgi:hypothetical protein